MVRLLGRGARLEHGKADAKAVVGAVTEHLGASAARWVLLNLEDLWLETVPQNTPGTSTECVNRRRKTRFRLELTRENRGLLEMLWELRRVRAAGSQSSAFR